MPAAPARADVSGWDVASPRRPGRTPGIAMAGFRVRSAPDPVRVVPHPSIMLLVEVGDRSVVDDGDGPRRWGSRAAGLGFGAGGTVMVRADDVECVEVRLSPARAGAVLGVAPGDLENIAVGLDELGGREAARLGERLGELGTWDERFAATDAWLARRAEGRRGAPDPEVAWVWRRIVATRGTARVEELAAEVGWSRKRLWTRFSDQIGAAPKHAATLVRFDRAAHGILAGLEPGRAAADGGYADQSHLHREVVGFAGVTPARLATEPFLAVDDVAWPARRR
ncbi:helix-turn-helix domain-containing protein [Luteimicrobium sp. DT211]|uniref:AraC family transcriptional regulator n=1 Tax=Luteimicrobium sp. DT211 TaxID=3393412 RepID=UPI003CE87646